MREVEGGLCEFDKYSRILNEEGRTRSIYKHNKHLPIVEDIEEGESIWAK
jgi:sRNA-binding regulator protein Hfq